MRIDEITRRDLLKGIGAAGVAAVGGAKVDVAKAADAASGKFDPNTLKSGDKFYKVIILSQAGNMIKYHSGDSYNSAKELEQEYDKILKKYNIGSYRLNVQARVMR